MTVVKINKTFSYRGKTFEEGKFYDLQNEPEGFIDHWITAREQGEVVSDPPAKTEILPDPRFPPPPEDTTGKGKKQKTKEEDEESSKPSAEPPKEDEPKSPSDSRPQLKK